VQKDHNFWSDVNLDKNRLNKCLEVICDTRKESKTADTAIDNLIEALQDFNMREISYILLYLDFLATMYCNKLLCIADVINNDNPFVINSILSFMNIINNSAYNSQENEDE